MLRDPCWDGSRPVCLRVVESTTDQQRSVRRDDRNVVPMTTLRVVLLLEAGDLGAYDTL